MEDDSTYKKFLEKLNSGYSVSDSNRTSNKNPESLGESGFWRYRADSNNTIKHTLSITYT